ncbi:MAG: hypothetical protein JXO22_18500 [Phycisphaerae bacterium]|nr:hypothetical protein [Phycisphaerae bacterium]
MDITPGTDVSVEIKAAPAKAAAVKTLYRVCRKDPAVAKFHRVMKANRPSWQTKRRGGRMWHHQMKTRPNVQLTPGAKYTVRATLDVIRDLASVERWITVTPV